MAWKTIPNEVIKAYTGKVQKTNKLDDDLEAVYKPFSCAIFDCDEEPFTNLEKFRDHINSVHDGDGASVHIEPEMVDGNVANLIMRLLMSLSVKEKDDPIAMIRKTNDSYHITEIWARVFPHMDNTGVDLKLKDKQYEWLTSVLDRKLPFSKEARDAKAAKEEGVEQQTLGMFLYGSSEDGIRQSLLTLSERRKPAEDDDPEETEPSANGTGSEEERKEAVASGVDD